MFYWWKFCQTPCILKYQQNPEISIYRKQNAKMGIDVKICIFRHYKTESVYLPVWKAYTNFELFLPSGSK
jgi:hypothetical protein